MNRRDALKSLAALAGTVGISVTPVTTHDTADVEMVILKSDRLLSMAERAHLRAAWTDACVDTNLARAKVAVLDAGLTIEFVRGRS
jgi:hypothetical protein